MLFDHYRPHVFRERRVTPNEANRAAQDAGIAVERRVTRSPALEAYAVHLAHDRTRIMTVEAWRDAGAFRRDADAIEPGTGLYTWKGTGGVDPTPVEDITAGVIVIDVFRVWRPIVGAVSAFNIRNGLAFNREPGCISTTVLQGVGTGAIATYARWRSVEHFAAAFSKITGRVAESTDGVNREAARMTFGFVRPDYHSYELVSFNGGV